MNQRYERNQTKDLLVKQKTVIRQQACPLGPRSGETYQMT